LKDMSCRRPAKPGGMFHDRNRLSCHL